MASLREHFGEDASLDAATTRSLAAWLVGNAAETFDTESANRFRVVAPDDPYRITATPYWVRKHAGIPPDVFARKSVRSKVNCHACHRDAESGRYDDQAIAIPRGVEDMKLIARDHGHDCRSSACWPAQVSYADPRRDAILAELLAQAKKDEAGFTRFSAERGAAFYKATHQGGKQGRPPARPVTAIRPLDKGKTRAGKDIEPMAVSKNPARYTDQDNVEKWFTPQLQRRSRAGLYGQGEGRLHHLHDGAVMLHEDRELRTCARGIVRRCCCMTAVAMRPRRGRTSASRRSRTRWSRRNAGAATWRSRPSFCRGVRGRSSSRRCPITSGRMRASARPSARPCSTISSPMPRMARRRAARGGSLARASPRRRHRSASRRCRAG